MKREALKPFGLSLTFPEGTRWDDLDPAQIRAWVDEHRVVVFSGLAPMEPEVLAAASRRLGPLQPWPFGAVHEIERVANAENYLYTEHEVPLHWDGAFASAVPHYLVFRCVAAPPAEAGGETVFAAFPSPVLLLVALAFGAMQTGVLLVNTAEDLDEDEREGIRTVAVALGAAGTVRLGRALAGLGGVALGLLLATAMASPWTTIALLPLAAALVYNERWLGRLSRTTRAVAEAPARAAIREQGKHVPRHVEAGAWAALAGAGAVFLSRLA